MTPSYLPLDFDQAMELQSRFNNIFATLDPNINVQVVPSWGLRLVARDYTLSKSEKQNYLCQQFDINELPITVQCRTIRDFFEEARKKHVVHK